jgi:hypothetical protein
MSKLGDLFVQVDAKGVSKVNRELGNAEKGAHQASKAMDMLKNALAGIGSYVIINAIRNVAEQIINLTMMHESALAKLTQQLENHNEATMENIEALKKQAQALQQVTTFSNDQILSAQAMLASFNLTTEQLKRMTPRLLDVAIMTENTTGQMADLNSVAKMVGVALSGQVGQLTRMGIKLNETQKALWGVADEQERFNLLLQIFDSNAKGLSTSVGKTFKGSVAQLKNEIEDIGKQIGEELLPDLKELMVVLKELVPIAKDLATIFKLQAWTHETRHSIEDWIETQLGLKKETVELHDTYKDFTDYTMSTIQTWKLFIRLGKDLTDTKKGEVDISKKLNEIVPITIIQRKKSREEMDKELETAIALDQAYWKWLHDQYELERRTAELIAEGERHQHQMEQEATFVTDMLSPIYTEFFETVLSLGAKKWEEWGQTVLNVLRRVIVQMMAAAAIAATLNALFPGLGSFGSLFKGLVGLGGYQTPLGDMFAYREGLDFGKFFIEGFNERVNQMAAAVNTAQQPVTVVVQTADPATTIKFFTKMSPQYKSKFHREFTKKAEKLE